MADALLITGGYAPMDQLKIAARNLRAYKPDTVPPQSIVEFYRQALAAALKIRAMRTALAPFRSELPVLTQAAYLKRAQFLVGHATGTETTIADIREARTAIQEARENNVAEEQLRSLESTLETVIEETYLRTIRSGIAELRTPPNKNLFELYLQSFLDIVHDAQQEGIAANLITPLHEEGLAVARDTYPTILESRITQLREFNGQHPLESLLNLLRQGITRATELGVRNDDIILIQPEIALLEPTALIYEIQRLVQILRDSKPQNPMGVLVKIMEPHG